MTQQPQPRQLTPQATAVHREWTQLVNTAFAQLNSGQLPEPSDLQKLERLVRWGLHIPYPTPAARPGPADQDRGVSIASRLMQVGHTFLEKMQPHPAGPAPAAKPKAVPPPKPVAAAPQPEQDLLVQERRARHPETPPQVLHQLAGHGDSGVRLALAHNPRLPPDLLERLSGDPDRMVRAAVAVHPGTPRHLLRLMATSSDKLVLLRVAQNPQAPPDVLTTLAQEHESKIRQAVAENPQTPLEVLEHMQHAHDEMVSLRAREALLKRETVVKEIAPNEGQTPPEQAGPAS